jgi:type II secretory pathway pseudopilin PulG
MKMRPAKGTPSLRRGSAGLTLLELVIAMAIIAFALFGLVSVIAFTTRSNLATKQRVLAMRAAERKIEQMSNSTFENIMILFNNTTQGFGVDGVEGLNFNPATGNANSQIVFVSFPLSNGGGNNLNETITGTFLDNKNSAGTVTNIDLDGDGLTNNAAVAVTAAQLIPVRVDVRWKGVMGNSELIYRYTFRRP